MTKKQSQSVRSRRVQHQEKQKRQRNLAIGIGIVAVVGVIGLLFWTRQITSNIAAQGIVTPTSIEQPPDADGKAWGPTAAPVLIEEYADYQCPYCGQFAREAGERILAVYGGTGKVRFEYNNFAFLGAESYRAAEAAECANDQGAFWAYHNALFLNQKGENQGAFNDRVLKTLATNLGLDETTFNSCLDSNKYRESVQAEHDAAAARGVSTTPMFYINGQEVRGALPFEQFQPIIEAALAGS
ncbi:MAG: DsbA family protein [Chloroflexi bacterium]|nr:DsbA family protein [Chloroflexota bacterium]MBP7043963.1 DsbA family protein [Chloroflexota bacterium]